MAGLDTRTGKRNVPPPRRAENIKEAKTPLQKIPTRSAVQTARQSVSSSSGTTPNSGTYTTINGKPSDSSSSNAANNNVGSPFTQLNFSDQQAVLMNRARSAAGQDYERDVNMARSFGQDARAREVNNQSSAASLSAEQQYAANLQSDRVMRNQASIAQSSQRQAENSAERQNHLTNAMQAGIADSNQISESQRQSSINAAQQRQAETQGIYSLLGSLNQSFSQGGYKYW